MNKNFWSGVFSFTKNVFIFSFEILMLFGTVVTSVMLGSFAFDITDSQMTGILVSLWTFCVGVCSKYITSSWLRRLLSKE